MELRTWLIVAAAITFVLALGALGIVLQVWTANTQIESLSEMKYSPKLGPADLPIEIVGRRFEWRLRYPSSRRLLGNGQLAEDFAREAKANQQQPDDVHVVNELHAWKDAVVHSHVKSDDEPHHLKFLNLRLSQDVIPGKVSLVSFAVRGSNVDWDAVAGDWKDTDEWQIGCGVHGKKMTGRLLIHKTKDDFLKWLRQVEAVSPQRPGGQE